MNDVKEHIAHETLEVEYVDPPHEHRAAESTLFLKNKKQLEHDGHMHCWICGSTENLEGHHMALEWCLAPDADYEAIKQFVEESWDIYGYGKLMKNLPVTSVDDIRCIMVLCKKHHTGKFFGIHNIPFPIWIAQKLIRKGIELIKSVI